MHTKSPRNKARFVCSGCDKLRRKSKQQSDGRCTVCHNRERRSSRYRDREQQGEFIIPAKTRCCARLPGDTWRKVTTTREIRLNKYIKFRRLRRHASEYEFLIGDLRLQVSSKRVQLTALTTKPRYASLKAPPLGYCPVVCSSCRRPSRILRIDLRRTPRPRCLACGGPLNTPEEA